MSVLFRKPDGPTRINQVQINQNVLGYAIPVVMGKGKVQQSILWLDGFSGTLVNPSTGGKGFGNGKNGDQYAYAADVIAGLCNGSPDGILGIGDVWSGQSWLSNTAAAETWTISGGAAYTPVNAATMTADAGVSVPASYSGTFNDVSAPSPTTLSGTTDAPYKRVAYGTTPSTGEYTVNPSTNEYQFATADVGKTVTLNYSFALSTVKKQVNSLVPSGLTITVGTNTDNEAYAADGGVVYYSSDETDPYNGTALTRVTGTPTVTGTYSVTLGSATWSGGTPSYESQPATYHFASGDLNQEVLITYEVNDPASIPVGTQTSLAFTLFEGTPGQEPWSLLTSSFPGAALGYPGIVLVAYGPMDLGYGAQIQQNTFEVLTADGWGGGISDCSPVQCILQVLSNAVWGLGAGAVPFPVAAIDNGVDGTWGTPGATGALRQDGTATSWFAANGFFISPVIDRQDTAASLIGRWLEAGQCAAFFSEGLLKLVPYGDTSTAGNGCVWTAPSEFAAALDDTCFLSKGTGKDPVKISSSPWQDAYNVVQVSWSNPAHQYAPEITPESDQAAINRYGSRIEDPQSWDFITSLPSATFAASMRVKRNVYTRNTYEFSLSFQYDYLEPMDVVYISTSSIWAAGLNNSNLAIVNLPVRIVKIVDNPNGTLDITAEDYPFGVHEPTIYNKNIAAGQIQPNEFSSPGDTNVVVFNAGGRLTAYAGNQIWIGASGSSDNWGSCNVYASLDGDSYAAIGEITAAARLGVLDSSFPSGSDPDTTHNLVVDLEVNSAALEAVTSANADALNSLCYVDGEVVAYSACAVSGPDQFTMGTYIRRAQLGTPMGSHAAASQFLRLDNSIMKYVYDPSWAGKTVYLKFQSVNLYGNAAQDLSTLTPLAFAVGPIAGGPISVSGTGAATVNTSALTDLPQLGTANSSMTIATDGRSATVSVALEFTAGSSGSTGAVTAIPGLSSALEPSYFASTSPYAPPGEPVITITGDGAGATASVSWSGSWTGDGVNFVPHLYIYGGSGYTTATATVTGMLAGSYGCTVTEATPEADETVQVAVLMDGSVIMGPRDISTDANGNAAYNNSVLVSPVTGNHVFDVQAFNPDGSITITSTNRTFTFVPAN